MPKQIKVPPKIYPNHTNFYCYRFSLCFNHTYTNFIYILYSHCHDVRELEERKLKHVHIENNIICRCRDEGAYNSTVAFINAPCIWKNQPGSFIKAGKYNIRVYTCLLLDDGYICIHSTGTILPLKLPLGVHHPLIF